MKPKRTRDLEGRIGKFLEQYSRPSRRRHGGDPNDRAYDRELEQKVKRMAPEELDRLMRGEEDGDATTSYYCTCHPMPVLEPSWLAWNDGVVLKLAQRISEDHAFDLLPLLGDALEDAGCSDPGILMHCRELAGHSDSCWVVDLLLGKP